MTGEQLFNMVEYIDEKYLQRSEDNSMADGVSERREDRHKQRTRIYLVAAAVAAVLLCSVTVIASIRYSRQQERLREILGIEDADIEGYEESGSGQTMDGAVMEDSGTFAATVLSGIRSSEIQRWYYSLGPLTAEEAGAYEWYIGNRESGFSQVNYVTPDYDELPRDTIMEYDIMTGYDEETMSFILQYETDGRETEPITMEIYAFRDLWPLWYIFPLSEDAMEKKAEYHTSITFEPMHTVAKKETVVFGDGIPVSHPVTGEEGHILDMTIYATGQCDVRYTYKGCESYEDGGSSDWSNAVEEITRPMEIRFKSGHVLTGGVTARWLYQDGKITNIMFFNTVKDPTQLECVVIDGKEFYPSAEK